MYTTVWSKYLPIIRIVMKRSLAAEQVLALNAVNELIQTNEFSIVLNPKYELTIRHIQHPEEVNVPE